ncbi:MAG TPA: sulfotransferase [Verrucomicrobiae bacterium]|nr:sulfotransferase [Verrucomicrobiae bacterium]
MKKSQLIATGSLNRMLQTAEEAWHRKDFQECLDMLERASRLAPSNINILLQLGRIHGLRYNFSAAEQCFEKVLRFTVKKTEALIAIADHCQNFQNSTIAENYLKQALKQPDATSNTYVKLAELYERLRRLPEASQLIEQALELDPTHPATLLTYARLERLAGKFESAERILRSFIFKPSADVWTHARAYYELGNILDRQKRYDEAMSAFLEAKTLMRPQAAKHLIELKTLRERLKVMETNVSSEMLKRWFDEAPNLFPSRRLSLLCGHARSGTTLLEQVLDSHSDIISAEETTIFVEDAFAPLKRNLPPDAYMLPVLEAAQISDLKQARTSYFHSMELSLGNIIGGRLLLDKNPVLTFMIPAFIRVFPETKFLIALRDPRDVVLSCFMQPQPLNPVTAAYLTLEGTVDDYIANMSLWRTFAPLMPVPYLEIKYEGMVENLESVARKTLTFLGVSWEAKVLGFNEHARNKLVRSPTYADVTQPIYKRALGRWQHYQKYLEPHLIKLQSFIKVFGYE